MNLKEIVKDYIDKIEDDDMVLLTRIYTILKRYIEKRNIKIEKGA